ncbi:hypothetical protein ACIGBH_40215 [Streptomyces sp. NPDC085929]|uniref:hypothetical protein n=1 Tax=Streptomyces sp. NPDC085929 TaxID=3365739 RepID=UPI0037D4B5A1
MAVLPEDDAWVGGVLPSGAGREGAVARLRLHDETGLGYGSLGELREPGQDRRLGWQAGRIDAEGLGRAVASPVEVGHVLPVLVGDPLEFADRPSGSIPPPRRHQT